MGMMDGLGGLLGGQGGHEVAGMVGGLLGQGGAQLPGLLEKFHAGGLGDVTQSWVGTGANLPVSPEQIKAVLGSDAVQAIAGRLGISPEQAASKLAGVLPQVIDKLTPDGIVPDPQALATRLEGLLLK